MSEAINFHDVQIDEWLVEDLRRLFNKEVTESRNGIKTGKDAMLIHEDDLKRVNSRQHDDWYLKRFLVAQKYPRFTAAQAGAQQNSSKASKPKSNEQPVSVTRALEIMKETFTWRAVNRVNEIYDRGPGALRSEFFTTFELLPTLSNERNKTRTINFLFNVSSVSSMNAGPALLEPYVWLVEAVDRVASERRAMIQIVIESRAASLSNVSVSLMQSFHHLVNCCFVGHVSRVVIVGMPFLLKTIVSGIIYRLGGEIVRCVSYGNVFMLRHHSLFNHILRLNRIGRLGKATCTVNF